MRFRFSMMCALGLAGALLTLDSSSAYAQTPTDSATAARRRAAARRAAARRAAAARARSERAISTTGKEVPVVESIARIDTVYQLRSDTVYRMRTDTVTVARVDTVREQIAPVYPTVRMGGFYWGLGGGLSAPRQQLNTIFEPGFNVTALLGWDPVGSPFGIRLDAEYDQFSERSQFAGLAADPQLFAVNLDGKLRLPFFSRESMTRAAVYAVGGGSFFSHRNLLFAPAGTPCCAGVQGQSEIDTWQNDFGWNAGGGVSFGFGPSDVFVEARWMGIKSNRSFVPIIIGLTF